MLDEIIEMYLEYTFLNIRSDSNRFENDMYTPVFLHCILNWKKDTVSSDRSLQHP